MAQSHWTPFCFSKPDLYFSWNIWSCSIFGIICFQSVWVQLCANILQLWRPPKMGSCFAEQTAPKDGQHERVCPSIGPMLWDSWGSAGDWLIQAGLSSAAGLVSTVLTHTSATIWLFWGWLLSTSSLPVPRISRPAQGCSHGKSQSAGGQVEMNKTSWELAQRHAYLILLTKVCPMNWIQSQWWRNVPASPMGGAVKLYSKG